MNKSYTNSSEIFIVGAGSTGLSAALFLADLGYKPRIKIHIQTPELVIL